MSLRDALADAPVVSRHATPQLSPQAWDCGCLTAVYVTDADRSVGGRPFEMRLVSPCDLGDACVLEWESS